MSPEPASETPSATPPTQNGTPTSPFWTGVLVRGAAALLLGWVLVLYVSGPSLTFEHDETSSTYTVSCRSLSAVGTDDWAHLDDETSLRLTYEVTDGVVPDEEEGDPVFAVEKRIMARCESALVHRASAIGLLGIPIGVLLVLSLRPLQPRQPREPLQPPQRHWSER
ncbi:MAG: hypothetical protein ACRDT6_01955 [Micromonosporaceae bacterium]